MKSYYIPAVVTTFVVMGTLGVGNLNLKPSIFQYPLLADEPIEKLEWVYKAQEVLRLEHNEMGRQYREGIIKEYQWDEYLAKSFDEKSKWLGHEASVLRTELGYTGYEILSTSTKAEAYRQEQEQRAFEKSTRWDVKTDAIFVSNIAEAAVEDFTTYTENDPNAKITVTSTKVDIAGLAEEDAARVYKDMGATHFSGNFEHLVEVYTAAAMTDGINFMSWGVSNSATMLSTSLGTGIAGRTYQEASNDVRFYITIASVQAGVSSLNENTLYYITYKRDEAIGTYGTAYVYVYSNSSRTTLLGSNSVALVTALYDYQYVYGFANYGNSAGAFVTTAYTQNLDLQEAAPATAPANQGIIFFD